MHLDHHHHPHEGGSAGHAHHAHVGHNGGQRALQWQTPHLPAGESRPASDAPQETDLDLVETSFVETFPSASDPVSFLRLAGVPFSGRTLDGAVLQLLRVQIDDSTDVGGLAPVIGGGFRYDPLPGRLNSRRRSLAFVYFDGESIRRLPLAEAKALKAA
jgi:hypothetical protein